MITVREVEDCDEDLANQLYEVATIARQMLHEQGPTGTSDMTTTVNPQFAKIRLGITFDTAG